MYGVPGGNRGPGNRSQYDTMAMGNRGYGVRYPSPFFDVASQFLPTNMHELFRWCRYYFLTNPIINVACHKMAEYPVTPIVWESDNDGERKFWTQVEDVLRLRQFQVEVGLDYNCYGNSFSSVMFKLTKYLKCDHCGTRYRAEHNRSLYKWKNGRYFLKCPHCKHHGYATQVDTYVRNIRGARLVRWNPENIRIKHNEATGDDRYFYKLPRSIINDIKLGDPEVIEGLPFSFLEAARKGRHLVFNGDNFFHLRRPTIAQRDQGWGSPLIYPLLKDAYYLQIMKKAQESLLLEHVVPLRFIFPGPSTGGNEGPYSSYNLANWRAKVASEINIWRRDHNHIPILPVNIGFQQLGGNARALILHHEFRVHAEQMLAGAGIPVEFVFGGLQWSSSNTSLRGLENTFLGYNRDRLGLIRFIIKMISRHLDVPNIPVRFERFKMADDLQRSMFYFQLNQAQKISDRTLMEEVGIDLDKETTRMDSEMLRQLSNQRNMQLASAEVQGAASLVQARYQAKSQDLMMRAQMAAQMEVEQEQQAAASQGDAGNEAQQTGDVAQQQPGMPEGATAYAENADQPNQEAGPTAMSGLESPIGQGAGGVDITYLAQRAASYLREVRTTQGAGVMYKAMEKMSTENPMLYQLVVQLMNDSGSRVDPTQSASATTSRGTREPARQVVG